MAFGDVGYVAFGFGQAYLERVAHRDPEQQGRDHER